MFETLPSPSLEVVLIAARGLLLIGAFYVFALAFIRWRRADERNTAALHAQLERAFVEVRSLHETVMVMSARIDGLAERAETESRRAPAGAVGAQRGYDIAMRLVKNGAGVEEVVTACGISRHEAELLVRLHGIKPREVEAPAARIAAPMPLPEEPLSEMRMPEPRANAGKMRGSLLSVVS